MAAPTTAKKRRSKRLRTASTSTPTVTAAAISDAPASHNVTPPASPSVQVNTNNLASKPASVEPVAIQQQQQQQQQERPKVLCLGMSYPSLEKQLLHYQKDPTTWLGNSPSDKSTTRRITVQDVLKCVQQGLLTEMDARDLARCVATEHYADVDVYTVSQEKAALYDETRHLDANFNRHRFVQSLLVQFGQQKQEDHTNNNEQQDIKKKADTNNSNPHTGRRHNAQSHLQYSLQFRQAILDYFWIPQGWDDNHWSPSLFTDILPALVERGLLDTTTNNRVPCGVYLPFCFHVFRQVINALPLLQQYYAISFLRKKDLHEISLWAGTQTIDPQQMQQSLGKQIFQEEIYCTFGLQEVMEAGEGPRDEPRQVLIDILSQLDDFYDIRMIKLRPIIITKPQEKGGLKGLVDPTKVKRGFHVVETVDRTDASSNHQKKNKASIKKAIPTTPRAKKALKAATVTPKSTTPRKRKATSTISSAKKTRTSLPKAASKKEPAKRAIVWSNPNSTSLPTRARVQTMAGSVASSSLSEVSSGLVTRRSAARRNMVQFVELPMDIIRPRNSHTKGSEESPKTKAGMRRVVTPSSVAEKLAPTRMDRATDSSRTPRRRGLDYSKAEGSLGQAVQQTVGKKGSLVSDIEEAAQIVVAEMTTNMAAAVPVPQDSMQRLEKKTHCVTDSMGVRPMNAAVVPKEAANPKKVGQAGEKRPSPRVVAAIPVGLAGTKRAPRKPASRRVSKTKPLRMTELAGFQSATEDIMVTPRNPGEKDSPNRDSPVSVLENLSYAKSHPKRRNTPRSSSKKSSLETEPEPSEESDAYTTDDNEGKEVSDDQASTASSDPVGTGVEEEEYSGLKLQERFDFMDQILAGRREREEPSAASEVFQDVDTIQSPGDAGGKKASPVATLQEQGDETSGTSVLVAATVSKKVATPRKKAAKGPSKTRPHRAATSIRKSSKRDKAATTTTRLNPEEAPTSVLMFDDFKKPAALSTANSKVARGAPARSARAKRVHRKS